MLGADFENMKREFEAAGVDAKIEMYINAEGLSQQQYTELLRIFPPDHIGRLEAALG